MFQICLSAQSMEHSTIAGAALLAQAESASSFPLIAAGIAVAVVLVLAIALWSFVGRRQSGELTQDANLSIDVEKLDNKGPLPDGPQLSYYGTQVRLVVLVLAPAGRGTEFPSKENLRDIVDRLVPDLSMVLDWHQPIYRQWPDQLSTKGFSQTLFNNMRLPGDRGKGTPWCGIAGRFEIGEGHLLAGLICRASSPNGLSQIVVEHEGQWNDIMRVQGN